MRFGWIGFEFCQFTLQFLDGGLACRNLCAKRIKLRLLILGTTTVLQLRFQRRLFGVTLLELLLEGFDFIILFDDLTSKDFALLLQSADLGFEGFFVVPTDLGGCDASGFDFLLQLGDLRFHGPDLSFLLDGLIHELVDGGIAFGQLFGAYLQLLLELGNLVAVLAAWGLVVAQGTLPSIDVGTCGRQLLLEGCDVSCELFFIFLGDCGAILVGCFEFLQLLGIRFQCDDLVLHRDRGFDQSRNGGIAVLELVLHGTNLELVFCLELVHNVIDILFGPFGDQRFTSCTGFVFIDALHQLALLLVEVGLQGLGLSLCGFQLLLDLLLRGLDLGHVLLVGISHLLLLVIQCDESNLGLSELLLHLGGGGLQFRDGLLQFVDLLFLVNIWQGPSLLLGFIQLFLRFIQLRLQIGILGLQVLDLLLQ
mmetsp:Transcript_10947/g.31389  ORF Transcript_10947/g.31389 Transcript_10947/m.31389 type:complete len:423 (+) Transcript_10947:441-1709(+)